MEPHQLAQRSTPCSSPTGPMRPSSTQVLKALGDHAPARLRRRGPRPHRRSWARSRNGEAFLLQAGDCAESFEHARPTRSATSSGSSSRWRSCSPTRRACRVVKVGRIAGQFAKPRSSPTETQGDGIELPSFRGHIVNDVGFTEAARAPDPHRLLGAYNQSRPPSTCCGPSPRAASPTCARCTSWNQEFVASSPDGERYEQIADEHRPRPRASWTPAASTPTPSPALHEVDFYTSHEALLLGYEEALTRQDSLTGDWYDCSAHMLWIGERTRQLDGAHVEFLRGVQNPIGCKIGPTATPDEVLGLCEALNPDRIPGRLTLISPHGRRQRRPRACRPLLAAVRDAGHPVVWACDPMHGNTFTAEGGHKTRHFDDVLAEIGGFFAAHDAGGHLARRHPRRAHRRRRHRVPRRRRRPRRRRPRAALRDHVRSPPQRPPVARPRLPRGRTPARRADLTPERDFSHRCIRVALGP